VVFF
jgi:gamma-aminobutyric acid type B receptor